MKPEIPLFQLVFDESDRRAADEVLVSGWMTSGPRVESFEKAFGDALGAEHVVAVSSCTAALHLALAALGIGPGDEVVVPALTFVAASNVVLALGATPVFADIESLEEPNISPASAARVLSSRTRAMVPVHYAGYPCRIDELLQVAHQAGAKVVEDSAHALITRTPRGACGTLAHAGAYSFFSNKNLAVGEGGALVTGKEELAALVRRLSSHGMTTRTLDRHRGHASTYDVTAAGYNYRWDEMRAAIAENRLARLPGELDRRRELAALYRGTLGENAPQASVPFAGDEWKDVPPHIFPVVLPRGSDRDGVRSDLREQGIETSVHYPLLPAFSVFAGLARGEWDVAAEYSARAVTLPFFPAMEAGQVERVARSLGQALDRRGIGP